MAAPNATRSTGTRWTATPGTPPPRSGTSFGTRPWAAVELERVEDREALMLGALLHDIGKALRRAAQPDRHPGRPRDLRAPRAAAPATTERVERLVELHLLLPDVATRRDLSDAALIIKIAEQIGDHGDPGQSAPARGR